MVKLTNGIAAVIWFVFITLINYFILPTYGNIISTSSTTEWSVIGSALLLLWLVFSEFGVTYMIAVVDSGK